MQMASRASASRLRFPQKAQICLEAHMPRPLTGVPLSWLPSAWAAHAAATEGRARPRLVGCPPAPSYLLHAGSAKVRPGECLL